MAEPTSKTYVDSIKNLLTELVANIALSGRLNLTDIHVVSEDFFAGLLNITYGWNLKNANIGHPNAEGFDLVDDNEKILVQVSATCKKTKIQHSLNEIDEAFQGYHFYFLPLITTKAESQKRQTYLAPHDVVFNPRNDIIEIVDLIRALQTDTTGKRLEEAFHFINDNLSRSIEERPLYSDFSELKSHLSEQLNSARECHPSFKLMKFDDGLFPQGLSELHYIEAVNDTNEIKTVSAFVAESWARREKNHLMIEGEGGIGKTVTLLSLPDKFVPHEVPAVYVQLHRLRVIVEKVGDNNSVVTVETIENYLRSQVFFNNDALFRQFEELTRIPWKKGPQVLLLLDGFNEITTEGRWAVGEDINRWAGRPGIQIITSSRFDIHSYVPLGSGYNKVQLQPLSRSVIKDYLEGLGIPQPRTKIQWNIITYPLMLFLYAQTKDAMADENRDGRIQVYKASNSAGAIIWNYLQRELWRYRQNNADVVKCVIAAEFIAPYIAWKMQRDSVFTLDENSFDDYLDEAYKLVSRLDNNQLPPHIRRVLRHRPCIFPECSDIQSFIEEEQLRLFIRNETTYSLMHQQFRDALAAMHLINLSYCSEQLPNEWKTNVDYYVMQFVAELSDKHEADHLWEMNRVLTQHVDAATINMLELQKTKRNYDFTELNFSGLDLRNISLFPYILPGSANLRLPQKGVLNDRMMVSEKTFYPEGHSSEVSSICITPDGRRIISGSYDCSIRIWDMDSGQCVNTFVGHTSAITALAITSDGKRCVSGSFDNTIRIWDIDSGQCLSHSGGITTLAITSDGKKCVSGFGNICIWDIESGQCIKTLNGDIECITSFAITPDGNKCVSGFGDICIWDIESGQCIKTLNGHIGSITSLAITPDGERCVSGGEWDNHICIWEMESGQCLKTLNSNNGKITSLAITPDGKRCVSGFGDNTICIWEMESGQCLKTLNGHKGKITALAITPDGNRCVSGSRDCSIRIWDMESGQCLKTLEGYRDSVATIAISADGNRCVSSYYDNSLFIRNLNSGRCLKTVEGHEAWISTLAITPDGKRCISGSEDFTLRIWDMESGRCLKKLVDRYPFGGILAITPEGKRFINKSNENTLQIWDMESGQCLRSFIGHSNSVDALSVFPDGSRCISGSKDETLRIWDLQTGKCEKILKGHSGGIIALYISRNGNRCVSGSDDTTLRIWDTESGQCLNTLVGHTESITTLVISPDGKRCVSGSRDCSLRIWDMYSGQCLMTLYEHSGWITSIAITPDGKKCISSSEDNTLRIWDMYSGHCLKTLKDIFIIHMTFSHDGKRCIACSWEGTVYELNLETYLLNPMRVLPLDISGVDLSKTIIPPEFKESLRLNGAIV